MCGIAGIIKFTPQPDSPRTHQPALTAMSQAIAHRGPDGSGQFIDPRPNTFTALLHRRLAILDQPGGAQPMPNEDGTVQVIFNGEIYNHAQLRRELQAAGHTFRSDHSDTEVLVHGWEQWGVDLPAKLTGMFAFAIWDARASAQAAARSSRFSVSQTAAPTTATAPGTLFLARDRLGQKPLFYATLEDGIVFASTLPAVLAWPEVPRRVPHEQLWDYLQYGYLGSWSTVWRDISQVRPGHWIRLRGELLDGGPYWSPIPHSPSEISNLKSQISSPHAALRQHLTTAVESQLIADTPIACFLSGGIDSSIIAALMQQAATRRGADPIHTVSVGFGGGEESGFDETAHAAAVAAHLGTRHTRLEVTADQNILQTLQLLIRTSLGQPFADSSILPTFQLSQAVRSLAPVALAGDGGDELFGGYDRYRAMHLLARWQNLARYLPRTAPIGKLSRRERYRRLAAAAREQELPERYARLAEICPPDLLAQLLPGALSNIPPEMPATCTPYRHGIMQDQIEYLPNDLLFKVDSAAMAHALEVRAPFLDHALVEFANTLPDDQLLHRGVGKHILRETFAPDLPPAILARKKQGFAVPIGTWFRTTLREPLHELLLSPTSFSTTHLHRPTLQKLLTEHDTQSRDHTHRLFALLMLELWAQEFKPTVE